MSDLDKAVRALEKAMKSKPEWTGLNPRLQNWEHLDTGEQFKIDPKHLSNPDFEESHNNACKGLALSDKVPMGGHYDDQVEHYNDEYIMPFLRHALELHGKDPEDDNWAPMDAEMT